MTLVTMISTRLVEFDSLGSGSGWLSEKSKLALITNFEDVNCSNISINIAQWIFLKSIVHLNSVKRKILSIHEL